MVKIIDFIKKDKWIITASLVIGFLVTLGYSAVYADKIQMGIAGEVIRFHVLANSDNEEDQALKLKVRDAILDTYGQELSESGNLAASRSYLQSHLSDIERTAAEVIQSYGYNYPVSVSLEQANFPTKDYGDIAFPAGRYEALRVEIGQAEGMNWWCVMFPPLCFVDITQNTVAEETKVDLKEILTNEEYDIVVKSKSEEMIPVKIKFKIVELWQEMRYPTTYASK